jgi:hypothetical protein
MTKDIAGTRVALACLLSAAAAGGAWAQDAANKPAEPETPEVSAPAAPAGLSALRPMIGGGFTAGGDKLATVFFTDGSSEDIKAGQLIQFYAGLVYQSVPQFSVQATVGYHVDDSGDDDAKLRFSRYPLEVLGHYHINDKWRFGGGVRFVNNAKFASSGDLSVPKVEFDNTTGVVVEGEFSFSRHLGLKLRYVSEEYEAKGSVGSAVDGSHVGVMLNVYF